MCSRGMYPHCDWLISKKSEIIRSKFKQGELSTSSVDILLCRRGGGRAKNCENLSTLKSAINCLFSLDLEGIKI